MRSAWNGFQSPLAEGIQSFLAYKRALGQSFWTEEKTLRLLDTFLIRQKVYSIKDITQEVIEAFLASRHRTRPRSYNHLVSVVRRLFNWLIKNSYVTCFPLQIQIRRENSPRTPFLFTPDMVRRLLACAGSLKDLSHAPLRGHTYRAIFALLYGLGLRVGEVSRLCIKDLDFERSLLVIRQTKFGKSRLVPFGPRLEKLLREYLEARLKRLGAPLLLEDPVFTFGQNRPIHPGTISVTFHLLVPHLGIQLPGGVSPPRAHDLRHSFAVGTLLRWYRAGIDPGTRLLHLSTFLGHVSPDSTAVYLTITPELLQEANNRFERFAAFAIQEVTQP